MTDARAALRAEILRSNRALRGWAVGLRARSRTVRQAAGATRAGTHHARSGEPVATAPDPAPDPALGDIAVTDLFVILVDDHGLGVLDAVRALATGLAVAGYPPDYDRVSAADAFDILHVALRPER
ncbi:hypothetical protein [Nocardioides caricicola]|uniref:ANTAR domain-containing protein n=1 Tax=Nocardioides caricicola TaxID=634770 RepID=A0ABW0N6D5_9ACTN